MTTFPSPARTQTGFTLVEVLVATLITSLIMIATLTALDQSRRVARKNLAVSEAQQAASYSMQEMAQNVRRAGYNLAVHGKRSPRRQQQSH